MIAALVCLAASLSRQDGSFWTKTVLPMPPNSTTALYIQERSDPMDPPKESPKAFGEEKLHWQFPWIVAGYSHSNGSPPSQDEKVRVYAQEQKGNKAAQVARMLMRIWEFNFERLKIVHNPTYHGGIIDAFLCFGGDPGGEQFIGEVSDPNPTNPEKHIYYMANMIYVYDMPSFTDPVEMAREVAHEYGHATLYPIGGFTDPERWANGYLAEKLDLRWISDAMGKGLLTPDDAMGATKPAIDKWLAEHADPLVMKAAQTLPTSDLLANPKKEGMDAFIGLALYVEQLYTDRVFARSLQIGGTTDAKDYPQGVVLAAEEPEQVTLKIPPSLVGKPIWIPLGTGHLSGAPILKKDPEGWVQIKPGTGPVVIFNNH